MLQFLPEFVSITIVHLLALMSPGPDFVLVSRNSLIISRRAGIYAALGISCGILIHVSYSLIGIAVIVSQSLLIFTTIKILGAGYLSYLGYHALRPKTETEKARQLKKKTFTTRRATFRSGFFTNLFNPKVTLFFLAVFTQLVSPTTPKAVQAVYGVVMFGMTFAWFAIVAVIFSHKKITQKFLRWQNHLEKIFGVLLIILALRLVFSSLV